MISISSVAHSGSLTLHVIMANFSLHVLLGDLLCLTLAFIFAPGVSAEVEVDDKVSMLASASSMNKDLSDFLSAAVEVHILIIELHFD
ncbi:hypothetical protein RN001_004874 [Aquatica leii]|uniref:Uncharacterized protein n=1 Tax=Aquatica leii TaxID=1421715 RepID=A0AAN7Q671_9COLE|nr:hypothetical protein RN001_004874 [Aquatica leii]